MNEDDLKSAWNEGYKDYLAGYGNDECPYTVEELVDAWLAGWEDAKYEEK